MNAIELTSHTNNLSFILLLISFSIIGLLYAFHYKYSKELILPMDPWQELWDYDQTTLCYLLEKVLDCLKVYIKL